MKTELFIYFLSYKRIANVEETFFCPMRQDDVPVEDGVDLGCGGEETRHVFDRGSLVEWVNIQNEQDQTPSCPLCRDEIADVILEAMNDQEPHKRDELRESLVSLDWRLSVGEAALNMLGIHVSYERGSVQNRHDWFKEQHPVLFEYWNLVALTIINSYQL